MKSETQAAENAAETVEKQLHDVINEAHQRSPQGQNYDRDAVRKIAEEYSRKYVGLVRRKSAEERTAAPSETAL